MWKVFFALLTVVTFLFAGCSSGSSNDGGSAGTAGSAGNTMGAGGAAGSGGMAGSGGTPIPFGVCSDPVPPGAEEAPDPPTYSGGACPTLTPGTDLNIISSGGRDRDFVLIVPEDPQPGETFGVAFLWHWLSGDGNTFIDTIGGQQVANDNRMILVAPNGIGSIPANWPWSSLTTTEDVERDFTFFDDMLACVSEQFPVNKNCVSSVGVSDGALWTSQLAGGRGEYLSSILVLSGGVDTNIAIADVLPWTPSPHKMPAVVLWGGPEDICLILQFHEGSLNLESALTEDGHFLIECIHNCGHAVPPLEAPSPDVSPFQMLWDFIDDHPYWLPDGASPYEQQLPNGFPNWCAIGMGNSTPRTDMGGCGDLGCPVSL